MSSMLLTCFLSLYKFPISLLQYLNLKNGDCVVSYLPIMSQDSQKDKDSKDKVALLLSYNDRCGLFAMHFSNFQDTYSHKRPCWNRTGIIKNYF